MLVQGALDGGLDIPHSEKRFVGYNAEDKKLDPEVLKKYIYGGHVAAYMEELKEESPEKYQTHFSAFIKAEIEADDLEDLYKGVWHPSLPTVSLRKFPHSCIVPPLTPPIASANLCFLLCMWHDDGSLLKDCTLRLPLMSPCMVVSMCIL